MVNGWEGWWVFAWLNYEVDANGENSKEHYDKDIAFSLWFKIWYLHVDIDFYFSFTKICDNIWTGQVFYSFSLDIFKIVYQPIQGPLTRLDLMAHKVYTQRF